MAQFAKFTPLSDLHNIR